MAIRPTLLNSCAFAATTAEARFRINGRTRLPRTTRVVALDPGAAALVDQVAELPWRGARFLAYEPEGVGPVGVPAQTRANGYGRLRDGEYRQPVELVDELAQTDFVLMVATANDGAPGASAIGAACSDRGIMTAGIVLRRGFDVDAAVAALRPYARVLIVTDDQGDVAEMLGAVGA